MTRIFVHFVLSVISNGYQHTTNTFSGMASGCVKAKLMMSTFIFDLLLCAWMIALCLWAVTGAQRKLALEYFPIG